MKVLERDDTTTSAVSFSSAPIHTEQMEGYSIIMAWTETVASLAGTVKLQASNNAFLDNVNNNVNPTATWVDITGSSVAVAGSGTQAWNVSDVYYNSVRYVWTRTSGTGTFVAYIRAKGQI